MFRIKIQEDNYRKIRLQFFFSFLLMRIKSVIIKMKSINYKVRVLKFKMSEFKEHIHEHFEHSVIISN